jgi:tRNA (mo5U34)-methyltransferase
MKTYQKAALVVAHEGISGLLGRIKTRAFGGQEQPTVDVPKENAKYEELVEEFQEKALALGHADISKYYWYHTVDLGNGLVTPGEFDYRTSLSSLNFPSSMTGMNVLDVGSATGFFAFEFEKRGANVVSVELPSIADWDMPTGEDRERTLNDLMADHHVNSIEQLHHYHLDGPFEFCRKALHSNVKRCYSTIYDLSPKKLGKEAFDMIFLGDVLLHTFAPLKALAALAPLCRDTLIVTQHLADEDCEAPPMMIYAGGATPTLDRRTWWYPNKVCMEQMLMRLGFKSVSIVGHLLTVMRPHGWVHTAAVIHAKK